MKFKLKHYMLFFTFFDIVSLLTYSYYSKCGSNYSIWNLIYFILFQLLVYTYIEVGKDVLNNGVFRIFGLLILWLIKGLNLSKDLYKGERCVNIFFELYFYLLNFILILFVLSIFFFIARYIIL